MGDCVPTLLTFQSGYISGYLVIAAAATLHLQMTFADTPELQSWLATPQDATSAFSTAAHTVTVESAPTLTVQGSGGLSTGAVQLRAECGAALSTGLRL